MADDIRCVLRREPLAVGTQQRMGMQSAIQTEVFEREGEKGMRRGRKIER